MMVFFKSDKLPGARGRSNYFSSILLRDLCKAVANPNNAALFVSRLMHEPFRIARTLTKAYEAVEKLFKEYYDAFGKPVFENRRLTVRKNYSRPWETADGALLLWMPWGFAHEKAIRQTDQESQQLGIEDISYLKPSDLTILDQLTKAFDKDGDKGMAQVFTKLEPEIQYRILGAFNPKEMEESMTLVYWDKQADRLEIEMPDKATRKVLKTLTSRKGRR
jgi:hypothetical protein